MCSECGFSRCPSGCPNAPEPEKVYTCKVCGENITVGDTYYEYDGDYYHEECFEDEAVNILLESGATKSTADESNIDDGSDDAYESWRDEQLLRED